MVKAIIFDLQGTLVENGVFPSPVKQVRFILGIRQSFHDYVPIFEKIFMTKSYDSLSDAFNAVCAHYRLDVPDFVIEKLIGIWNKNKLLSQIYPETVDILTDLRKDHKLILVANIDCFTREVIDKFKLREYFDEVFLSYDSGLLKTDKGFYEMILDKISLTKDDVLMVGDSVESDMKSAQSAGIRSVLIDRNNRMIYDQKILGISGLIDYLKTIE